MRTALAVTGLGLIIASASLPAEASGGAAAVVVVAPWRYSPNPIEVSQGEKLTFANFDSLSGEGHSLSQAVKPGQELFQSRSPRQGPPRRSWASTSFPRGIRFTCRVHAFMNGRLVVK